MPRTIKKRPNISPLSIHSGGSSTASITPVVSAVRSGVDWYKKKLRKGGSGSPVTPSGPDWTRTIRGGK